MTWVPGAAGSGYGVRHLPYGVVVVDGVRRPAVRIGDFALDLAAAEAAGVVDTGGGFQGGSLMPFLAAGPRVWADVRGRLVAALTDPAARPTVEPLLRPLDTVQEMALPFDVADYVDFYSSEHHAANVGEIFRPGQPPLLPNWRHLPVGYHGRAGTVVVS
jgi:fumarylacetoacetase